MISRRTVHSLLVALLATGSAASSLHAQHSLTKDLKPSLLVKQMEQVAGQTVVDYWTPRLNDYKTQIDRMVSADDLTTLNRLRVRWSVLLGEGLQKLKEARGAEGRNKMKMGEDEMAKVSEVMEIYAAAKEIAQRYRSQLDPLGVSVVGDVSNFMGTMADRADQFAAENSSALQKDDEAQKVLGKRQGMRTMATELGSEKKQKELLSVYTFALEPVVLLYNGTDLKSLVENALPMIKPIAGINLPESSTLKQNFPNPASSSTRIVYNLSEPSSATTVRVFDSRGELISTYDQGAEEKGEHALDIDVSKLSSGSYLYHLTTQTAAGQRVYSKTMQIVK